MNLIFFDTFECHEALKPFTLTRPVSDIRIGICKIFEKWERFFSKEKQELPVVSFLTQPYLSGKYPANPGGNTLFLNGAVCPDAALLQAVLKLENGEILLAGDNLIACKIGDLEQVKIIIQSDYFYKVKPSPEMLEVNEGYQDLGIEKVIIYENEFTIIRHTWDIFGNNHEQLSADFHLLTYGRKSAEITDPFTRIYSPENVFVEEGVNIKAALINAEEGPVYLGKNAVIHENAAIKGPFALCEGATINMGSKIREGTTVGPYCKVGGEVKNTVFFANSNKGHEGFVGNSVVGEWCNFGADTNTSNLKNNYSPVKLWNYKMHKFEETGLQFCGLMMGDHSKCSINTMFNTGTVIGTCVNVFGNGFPPKFLPSFTWGGIQEILEYQFEKALETAQNVVGRRKIELTKSDFDILRYVYENRKKEL